jgi:hypothetical protein
MSLPAELFRTWPNSLLPILRQHGFSLCLLRSMRLRLNIRTQPTRFQKRQPSDSSATPGANQGRTAVRSAMHTRYVLAPARTKYAWRISGIHSEVLAQSSDRHFLSSFQAGNETLYTHCAHLLMRRRKFGSWHGERVASLAATRKGINSPASSPVTLHDTLWELGTR